MSKCTWVGFGGWRCRGSHLSAAAVGLAVAGLLVAAGWTGALGFPPGSVEAPQAPAAPEIYQPEGGNAIDVFAVPE